MGIKITQALQQKLDGAFGKGSAQVFYDEYEPYRKPLVDGEARLMHAIADMRTPENIATMEGFAAVAEAFNRDGSIIA